MARKTKPLRGIQPDETFSDSVAEWASQKYPTVDLSATFEIFSDHCKAHGSMYQCFDAALRTWIRNAVDKGYGGVVYKTGRAADPRWASLLSTAKQYGFPESPDNYPTPASFSTAFERWKSQEKRSTVLPFENPLKGMR